MVRKISSVVALLVTSFVSAIPASFALDTWEFKTGKGESVLVKKGLFGTKTVKLKDRMGNGYESDNGFWGSKKNSVSFLGNGVTIEKNVLGRNSIQASSILGDKIETKRSWFGLGPRRTYIDASGVTNLAEQLLKKQTSSQNSATPTVSRDSGEPKLD